MRERRQSVPIANWPPPPPSTLGDRAFSAVGHPLGGESGYLIMCSGDA
jgi:hypothetical protein